MRLSKWALILGGIGLAAGLNDNSSTRAAPADAAGPEAAATSVTEPTVLRTQQFENGELKLPEVDADRLEGFLRDLNQRRDYDFSQHGHHPGLDNEYLTRWVGHVMDELISRGYYVDKHGDLHRPGAVVATR